MNILQVSKILAILLLMIAGFMLIPAFLSFLYDETACQRAFTVTIILMLLVSLPVLLLRRNRQSRTLSTKSSFLLVTLSWITASLFGALPFFLSEAIPSFTDAFFETMSGFSTTGASILTSIETLPRSMLFWRSLTHWLGGMGIVVLTVAILPLLGIGGLQLLRAEAPGPTVDKITPRIAETAKILWGIYLGFTVAEIILLMLGGMDLFDAATHTFGTLATGGFSPKNASVGHYNSGYIDAVITVFMLLAGINFTLHFRMLTGKFRQVYQDTEFKVYLTIFLVATCILTYDLFVNYHIYNSLGESVRYAAFQAASILTTTGYATADFENWPFLSQTVLFFLMFIGGCSGSTGGGIKVIRVLTLIKTGLNEMKYLIHPRGVFTLKIGNRPLKKDIAYAISGFFIIYIFMLLLVTMVVSTAEHDVLTSFTTALVTVGNIGPGLGDIGPAENYAFYADYIKWFLCFAMLVGRLEIYTVLIIFTPIFWKK
jgi:trk system potassium uptake protein TrkH